MTISCGKTIQVIIPSLYSCGMPQNCIPLLFTNLRSHQRTHVGLIIKAFLVPCTYHRTQWIYNSLLHFKLYYTIYAKIILYCIVIELNFTHNFYKYTQNGVVLLNIVSSRDTKFSYLSGKCWFNNCTNLCCCSYNQ